MNYMNAWKSFFEVELNFVSNKEKIISGLGGFFSILALIFICQKTLADISIPLIVSMGASAVLLFALPSAPLAQPWAVIAGHLISACIGVACFKYISSTIFAAASAVGLAILAMHYLKCIHPPGGSTALIAVIGGQEIHRLGFKFVITPVLVNALVMVLLAILINNLFERRRYPSYFNKTEQKSTPDRPLTHEEVVEAIKSLHSFVDISEKDLIQLSEALSQHRKN